MRAPVNASVTDRRRRAFLERPVSYAVVGGGWSARIRVGALRLAAHATPAVPRLNARSGMAPALQRAQHPSFGQQETP